MSEMRRKNFELAFITACRKNETHAAYAIFANDDPTNIAKVRIYVGGEETAAALLKRIMAAGQHAVAVDIPTEGYEARLELLFKSLNVKDDNAIVRDWALVKQELHRVRETLRAVCGVEGVPMKDWPLHWKTIDERCAICRVEAPLVSIETAEQALAAHQPQCGFRRAYETLTQR